MGTTNYFHLGSDSTPAVKVEEWATSAQLSISVDGHDIVLFFPTHNPAGKCDELMRTLTEAARTHGTTTT